MTLPRFRNSENVELQLYPLPYRAARSFTRNPIFRFMGSGELTGTEEPKSGQFGTGDKSGSHAGRG
jgi:hypothetical protein